MFWKILTTLGLVAALQTNSCRPLLAAPDGPPPNREVLELAFAHKAKVLVFLNQETVSRDRPEPSLVASSVVVSVTKVDEKWLISALDPV